MTNIVVIVAIRARKATLCSTGSLEHKEKAILPNGEHSTRGIVALKWRI